MAGQFQKQDRMAASYIHNTSQYILNENITQFIWKNRWIFLVSIVSSLLISFIYILKATPIYTSTSRIYVEQSGPKILTEVEGVMTKSMNYLNTQAELLKSTPILSSVLDNSAVRQMEIFRDVDNTLIYLKKLISISVGRKDDIINVSLSSPNPVETAHLVNLVVDSYITYNSTQKKSTAAEVLKILRAEKERNSIELADKLQAIMDFRKEHEALAFEGREGNVVIDRLERLSQELTEAQLSTIEYKTAYDMINSIIGDSVEAQEYLESQDAESVLLSIQNERAELVSKLQQLQQGLAARSRQVTQGHPAIKAFEEDIHLVKSRIEELDKIYLYNQLMVAEQEYLAAVEKEKQIEEYYNQQSRDAFEYNEQLAQYSMLQADWEQTKKLCDILDERIKELNVTEDTGALNISILETARPADTPSSPQKAKYMLLALFAGNIIGYGLSVLRGFLDQKLHSLEEISTWLGIHVLGVIPVMSRRESIQQRGTKVYLDSKSQWAEAYRTIRTAVYFGNTKEQTKIMLVTSPAPGDGKTTLVSNLAITMAQAGQNILILDADLRKPMQHSIFKVNNDNIGFINILKGSVPIDEAIQHTNIRRLDILSRGLEVSNPSEILNSNNFAKMLRILSKKYDRIIVDSPPVSPVTDALILAAICDATIMVLRADKSTKKLSHRALDRLMSVGAHVLGIVVNGVSTKNGFSGYGGYGQYYNYYGNETEKKQELSESSNVGLKV